MTPETSTIRKRPMRIVRAVLLWLLVVSGISAAAWLTYRAAAGKMTPPTEIKAIVERSVAVMRKEKAERWAPELTRSAEKLFRDALTDLRREEVTFVLFRDCETPLRSLLKADEAAKQATRVAIEERKRLRNLAEAAVGRAREAVHSSFDVADSIHLGVYEHSVLQRANLALKEAELLFNVDEYKGAQQRADLALLQADRVTDRAAKAAARFTDPNAVRRWKNWIDQTLDGSRRTGGLAIIVSKEGHTLTLYKGGQPIRKYKAELGYNSVRDKQRAGDSATPEGRYKVISRKGAGDSKYYKALLLNYPNDEDRAEFARLRRSGELPSWAKVGGLIEIHGGGGRGRDWTNGCVALADNEMDDLFRRVPAGTPVTIVGSDGTAGTFTNVVRMQRLSAASRTD